ncbi:MAG: tRNA lysidine(34) synthetase TilS [Prevotellaceae bacterium]|jgi:tRNA(Ile)-lysidine synthase|nr:tRNA lysidine(34) synthetase TilS [Prevotellaceae bacterium]
MFLQRFQRYCAVHGLPGSRNRWLLAVSGGLDSMTLAHLCHSSGWKTGIAHCNFSLRGSDSDGDEQFVQQWARQHAIPFFSIRFDTRRHAETNGISIQMAARTLRYEWFEELCAAHDFAGTVTAHHADDNAETLLLHLTRGTGLRGLCGMQPVGERIVRPLLFAARKEIAAYAAGNNIAWREDASNATTAYARNRIRHNVFPELQKINPSLTESLRQTACHLAQACRVIDGEREKIMEKCCSFSDNEMHISIAALRSVPQYDFWLFEILQPCHFSGTVAKEIAGALDAQAGRRFYSPTHALIKDRDTLIVTLLPDAERREAIVITENCRTLSTPVALHFERRQHGKDFTPSGEKQVAHLAAEKLKFPLTLRLWRDGDAFKPFGMTGMKKVSDFLIDEKVPLHEKARQYVLVSDGDIVWVVGRRMDERYKITDSTKEILTVVRGKG